MRPDLSGGKPVLIQGKLTNLHWEFVGEGIVDYRDRTPIEAWVEQCAFGVSPTQRSADEERAAYDKAVQAMKEQAISQTNAVPT